MSRAGRSLKWVLLDLIHRCNHLRSFNQIHAHLLTSALVTNDLVITQVVNVFRKHCTDLHYPCNFLKQFDWSFTSFPFNLLISGYASSPLPWFAILIYRWTFRNGFVPDVYTVPAVLKSCAKFCGIAEVRQFHSVTSKTGLLCDIYVQNSLVHVYSICEDTVGAGKVFDDMLVRDVVSWTGLISGYVKAGLFNDSIALFLRIDVERNVATFVSVLGACGKLGCLNFGKGIHGLVLKCLYGKELLVCNAVLDMYIKCFEPDGVILTSVLSACASLGHLDYERLVHEYIDRSCIKWDVHIGIALVDIYGQEALKQFEALIESGTRPNEVTFLAVFTACCHSGLVDEGHRAGLVVEAIELIKTMPMPPDVQILGALLSACNTYGYFGFSKEMLKTL
ncbi:hypothetical protein RJT34_25076 [Clitoria ternatea]|uniref:Pentatricopeptide repeat-containing protein n=1 Tax=Clitoria ternatea TaxID=43366 RepID=A0AAN9IIK9_CLITE